MCHRVFSRRNQAQILEPAFFVVQGFVSAPLSLDLDNDRGSDPQLEKPIDHPSIDTAPAVVSQSNEASKADPLPQRGKSC